MCGIVGFIDSDGADEALLRRMCDAIYHRGPDEDGYFVEGNVALGARRLSIIDLSTGKQPIYNEDHTIAIVYNGETYNFPQLRRKLEAKGHEFGTQTDTECVVHLYEDYGDRCVEHLRGMFAFAIWDARKRRLLLARDRVGKKPLFYRVTPRGIWFGSELKSLLQDPSFPREVDQVALHHYLTYQYVPAPLSIYRGVQKLPPAHTLSYENGRVELSCYWSLHYRQKLRLSEEEAVEQLRDLLREATAIRLISDRPLGAFLSGGVDSSFIVGTMAEQMSQPVNTFSMGFEDQGFDEREYARMTARRFGTDHHELVVRPSARNVLPTLVWHHDEPFSDSSSIPTYYLAAMTRQHVTVALNGDGGDESFGGYPRYAMNLLAARLQVPNGLRPLAERLLRALPEGREPNSLLRRAKRYLDAGIRSPQDRYVRFMCQFDNERKVAIYTAEMRDGVRDIDSYDLLAQAFGSSDGPDLADQMMHVDVQTYLPGALLAKMDIATMANSLEARSPFLDHKVMEFAASLPSRMKIRGRMGKYILKKAARGWLPDEVLDRQKMGFGVPLASWLRGELRDLVHDALTDHTARSRGYFDPAAVNRLIIEHESGINHSSRIWTLMQFELWHRMFIDGRAETAPARPDTHSLLAG